MRFSQLVVALTLAALPATAFLVSMKPLALVSTGNMYRRARQPLYMAGEVESAQLALDSLPYFLAPAAALVAGSQGLSRKKELEELVTDTEMQLEEVKEKLSGTDVQIAASFGVAVISAGLVAANVFGVPNGVPSSTTSTVTVPDGPQAKLLPTPAQEEVTKIVAEKAAEGKAAEGKAADALASETTQEKKSPVETEKAKPAVEAEKPKLAVEVEPPKAAVEATKPLIDVTKPPVLVAPGDVVKKVEGAGEAVLKAGVAAATKVDAATTESPPVAEKAAGTAAVEKPKTETSSPFNNYLKKLEFGGTAEPKADVKPESPPPPVVTVPSASVAEKAPPKVEPITTESTTIAAEKPKPAADTVAAVDASVKNLETKSEPKADVPPVATASSATVSEKTEKPAAVAEAPKSVDAAPMSPFNSYLSKLESKDDAKTEKKVEVIAKDVDAKSAVKSENNEAPVLKSVETKVDEKTDTTVKADAKDSSAVKEADVKTAVKSESLPIPEASTLLADKPPAVIVKPEADSSASSSPFNSYLKKLETAGESVLQAVTPPKAEVIPEKPSDTVAVVPDKVESKKEPVKEASSADTATVVAAKSAEAVAPKSDADSKPVTPFNSYLKKLETSGDSEAKADVVKESQGPSPFDSLMKKLETTGESVGKVVEIKPAEVPVVPAVEANAETKTTEAVPPVEKSPETEVPNTPTETVAKKIESAPVVAAQPSQKAAVPSFGSVLSQKPSSAVSLPGSNPFDGIDPQILIAGGVLGTAAVVAAAVMSSGNDGSSAVMPPGTKKKDATYLDGLTRSTANLSSKRSTPSSYLDTLKSSQASSSSPPKGADTLSNSYIRQLATKAGGTQQKTPTPSFNFGQTVAQQARVPPPQPPPPTPPMVPKPEALRAPPINGSARYAPRPESTSPVQASPGMSYLESVATKSSQDFTSRVKPSPYMPTGGAKPPAKQMGMGSSYLDSVQAAPEPRSVNGVNGYTNGESWNGEEDDPVQANGSYLSGIANQGGKPRAKPSMYGPKSSVAKVVATGSYLDNL